MKFRWYPERAPGCKRYNLAYVNSQKFPRSFRSTLLTKYSGARHFELLSNTLLPEQSALYSMCRRKQGLESGQIPTKSSKYIQTWLPRGGVGTFCTLLYCNHQCTFLTRGRVNHVNNMVHFQTAGSVKGCVYLPVSFLSFSFFCSSCSRRKEWPCAT